MLLIHNSHTPSSEAQSVGNQWGQRHNNTTSSYTLMYLVIINYKTLNLTPLSIASCLIDQLIAVALKLRRGWILPWNCHLQSIHIWRSRIGRDGISQRNGYKDFCILLVKSKLPSPTYKSIGCQHRSWRAGNQLRYGLPHSIPASFHR